MGERRVFVLGFGILYLEPFKMRENFFQSFFEMKINFSILKFTSFYLIKFLDCVLVTNSMTRLPMELTLTPSPAMCLQWTMERCSANSKTW